MKCLGFKLSLVLSFIFVFSSYAYAGTHEDMVEKYISLSGISETLKSIPGTIDSLASQKTSTSNHPEVAKKIFQLMKDSYDTKEVQKAFFNYLLGNTDQKFLEEKLEWLESPLGKKITKEEVNSIGPERRANVLRYLADLQSKPPDQERIFIINKLEEVTHGSEAGTNIFVEVMKGMMNSMNLASPEGKRQPIGDIYGEIEKIRPTIQEGLRQRIVLGSFYTYRNISNEELSTYIKICESELEQNEIRIIGAAFAHVLRHWFDDFGKKLVVLIEEESEKCKE